MPFPSDETKDNIKLAWLSVQEALYTFAPWQRLVLIGGIIMIIPAYWIFRLGTKAVYGQTYKKYEVTARPSFENPGSLTVGAVTVLPVEGGGYIAYAKLANPNLKLFASQVRYAARFQNVSGQQMYQTSGQLYIAPGKDTYVVIPRFSASEVVTTGKIEIIDLKWQQKFSLPEVSLSTPAPIAFSEKDGVRLEGVLINNSPYQLGAVRIVLFLYDSSGRIVAASERNEFSVKPGERRAYVLRFPGFTTTSFARVVPTAETNIADVANIQTSGDRLQLESIKPK